MVSGAAVVVVNECHNGAQRCVRTREVGQRLLPCAHKAGVRVLAVEALSTGFAQQANERASCPMPPRATSHSLT